MVFSVIYQTQSCIDLGSVYTSSHTISDSDDDIITYSATVCDGAKFNEQTGDFTIKAVKEETIKFTIIVKNEKGTGYNIPININVIDESKTSNFLQYSYQTGYLFSAAFYLYPTYLPEFDNEKQENPYLYMLVGAPSGIVIDASTGQIAGSPINYGQFIMTIHVINKETNVFVCSSTLHFMIYNSNILTEIIDIRPNNEIIHSNNLPLTIKCNYTGAPPSSAQSLSYQLTCPIFKSASIINYISSDTVELTYLVNVDNIPGPFPIILTDQISGFFITSPAEINFTATAACFNDDTTILTINSDNQEEFKCIKDIKIGDKVVTYNHSVKRVTHIGSRTMINNPNSISDSMYKLTVRLSKDKITHDLILLGRHSLLVDKLTKRQQTKTLDIHPVDKIDNKELLITMFNDDFDPIEEKREFKYFHLVLEKELDKIDRRYGVYVNGSVNPEDKRPGMIAATTYEKDFLKQFS